MTIWTDDQWWELDANRDGTLPQRLRDAGMPCIGVRNRKPFFSPAHTPDWLQVQCVVEASGFYSFSAPSSPVVADGPTGPAIFPNTPPKAKKRGRPRKVK